MDDHTQIDGTIRDCVLSDEKERTAGVVSARLSPLQYADHHLVRSEIRRRYVILYCIINIINKVFTG